VEGEAGGEGREVSGDVVEQLDWQDVEDGGRGGYW